METPPAPSSMVEKPNNMKFTNEYNLNFDNTDYLLKLGTIPISIEELIIFVQENNDINAFYYQGSFSLEKLQNMNKFFRQFDSIDEIINMLKEIIEEKKISIKKINNDLAFALKIKKLGKGEEEINILLTKTNISNQKIIENLISHINDMKLEINKLKNEISNNKISKKYIPKFENGWNNFYQTYEPLTIYKNQFGEVKFQGLILGDFSKKIFTLEEELRPKERLLFTVCANDTFQRVDILPNGNVCLSIGGTEGINGSGWLSLSGISYYISK